MRPKKRPTIPIVMGCWITILLEAASLTALLVPAAMSPASRPLTWAAREAAGATEGTVPKLSVSRFSGSKGSGGAGHAHYRDRASPPRRSRAASIPWRYTVLNTLAECLSKPFKQRAEGLIIVRPGLDRLSESGSWTLQLKPAAVDRPTSHLWWPAGSRATAGTSRMLPARRQLRGQRLKGRSLPTCPWKNPRNLNS